MYFNIYQYYASHLYKPPLQWMLVWSFEAVLNHFEMIWNDNNVLKARLKS